MKRIHTVTKRISADSTWTPKQMALALKKGDGWKGFRSGIGSKHGWIKVTIMVERITP